MERHGTFNTPALRAHSSWFCSSLTLVAEPKKTLKYSSEKNLEFSRIKSGILKNTSDFF